MFLLSLKRELLENFVVYNFPGFGANLLIPPTVVSRGGHSPLLIEPHIPYKGPQTFLTVKFNVIQISNNNF